MTQSNDPNRKQRASSLRWVPIVEMKVSPKAQREFKEAHAAEFAADFDLEALGFPVVNQRDGSYWIVDGQHRVAALKMIGWEDQKIQCEVYHDLSEAEEAELFLRRDKRRAVQAFDRFRIGIVAGRDIECDINRIVQGSGLRVSTDDSDRSISAVGSLYRTYRNGGPVTLGRAIRILRDGFPEDGNAFRREMLDGAGLICQRYNGELDDKEVVAKLAALRGGAMTVMRKAAKLRAGTGEALGQCVAAALVEVTNSGRGGKKLPGWFKE